MDARSKAGHFKFITPVMRVLASTVIAIIAVFVTGFVSEAYAQATSTIVVRARGTAAANRSRYESTMPT